MWSKAKKVDVFAHSPLGQSINRCHQTPMKWNWKRMLFSSWTSQSQNLERFVVGNSGYLNLIIRIGFSVHSGASE